MQTLLGLIVCLVLITTGTALECEVCASLGITCTGPKQTCADGKDTCAIVLSETSLVGNPIYTINKDCVSSSICKQQPKYMNFGQGKKIRSSVTCCVGDACKTANPQLPPDITKPNGKRCPSCYTVSSHSACGNEMVDCIGPEENCLDMTMSITYGKLVLNTAQKGCVSQSICDDLKTGETIAEGVTALVTKAECKAAPAASA